MSIIPTNPLKKLLSEGKVAVGTMVAELRQIAIVQCLLNAGFDWLIIDNEHGTFSSETIADLCRAARWVGVTPVVRVPVLHYDVITRTLEGGAQGLMLPRLTNPEQLSEAISQAKYPPLGIRGSAMGRGHTDFKAANVVSMMEDANREILIIGQIETAEAVDCVAQIAAVPGLDALLIGPNDLSIALGCAGDLANPVLEAAIEKTIAACRQSGIVPGIHTNDAGLSGRWAGRGMRLVSVSTEIGFLQAGATAAVAKVREVSASLS